MSQHEPWDLIPAAMMNGESSTNSASKRTSILSLERTGGTAPDGRGERKSEAKKMQGRLQQQKSKGTDEEGRNFKQTESQARERSSEKKIDKM